jgi:glyoxylase-like metal-dependent hydrolase (beta-lactamase superfamily II)
MRPRQRVCPSTRLPDSNRRHVSTHRDFSISEERLAGLPERLAGPACFNLPVLQRAGLMRTVEEAEVLPGIRLLHAPGHTPGHMAVAITSGRHGATHAR